MLSQALNFISFKIPSCDLDDGIAGTVEAVGGREEGGPDSCWMIAVKPDATMDSLV